MTSSNSTDTSAVAEAVRAARRRKKGPQARRVGEEQAPARPEGDADVGGIVCVDPATGEVLGTVSAFDAAAVQETVARARGLLVPWGAASLAERRRVLSAVLDLVVERQQEICTLIVRDSGKTMVDALLGEVFPLCELLRYLIDHGEADLAPQTRSSGLLPHKAARVEYLPLGVVGVIAPRGAPLYHLLAPVLPALFAGNAVVIKPSEWSSWSAAPLLELVQRALRERGHSPELVQLVTGDGVAGAHLVRAGVDKVFFCGSARHGVEVLQAAAATLTPVVLQLGGKDPMIVCDDADLDRAVAQAMMGIFGATAPLGMGAERIYVLDAVYDAFLSRLVIKVEALRQGPPERGELVDCGALANQRQVELLEELVVDAVQRGARVVVGGRRRLDLGGCFFAPTVLVDVDPSMRIHQEQHLGPVAVVMRVPDEDEAVRQANDAPSALGASVFTRDLGRGERLAARLRGGCLVINDVGVATRMPALPFGGAGSAGFGRVAGREGLRACCQERAVVTDRLASAPGVSMYPMQPESYALAVSALQVIYGRGLRQKAPGVRAAAKTLWGMARDRLGRSSWS